MRRTWRNLICVAGTPGLMLVATSADACPDCQDNKCVPLLGCACVPKIGCTVPIPIPGTTPGPNQIPSPIPGQGIPSPVPIPSIGADVIQATDKGIRDLHKEVKAFVDNTIKASEKGAQDVGNTLSKANEDTKAEADRAAKNVEEAGQAVAHYVEREIKSQGAVLSNAERRIREGKVVDAFWHLGVEPLQNTESNAALAAQESALLRTVGAAAASAYGGPSGAAAYAAWLTYKETGDANLALRVGILAGASSAAFGAAGDMPSGTSYELAKKTVVTGAIGGLAVAAAGGNDEAIKAGFLSAGAMVLVQDGYKKYTGHPLDATSSEGEAYCMKPGEPCSPPEAAMLKVDENGNATLDMSKVDPKVPAVGMKVDPSKVSWQSEQSTFMTSVSRVPGMQAMAVFHDTWTMGWSSDLLVKASIVPAVVLTYAGTGAPYYDLVRRSAIDAEMQKKYPADSATPPAASAGSIVQVSAGDKPASAGKEGLGLPLRTSSIAISYMCSIGQEFRQVYVDANRRKKDGSACRVGYLRAEGTAEIDVPGRSAKACERTAERLVREAMNAGWTCFVGAKAMQASRTKRLAKN